MRPNCYRSADSRTFPPALLLSLSSLSFCAHGRILSSLFSLVPLGKKFYHHPLPTLVFALFSTAPQPFYNYVLARLFLLFLIPRVFIESHFSLAWYLFSRLSHFFYRASAGLFLDSCARLFHIFYSLDSRTEMQLARVASSLFIFASIESSEIYFK